MITYEMILETLAPAKNIFSSQPNIIFNSSNFTSFSNIFDNSFYRYGATNNITTINTSLYDSIIYCIECNNLNIDIQVLNLSAGKKLNRFAYPHYL